jgi:CxxC motif-containing protein
MKKNLICINCPLGCLLEVEFDNKSILGVAGASCKRGNRYAEKEIFSPERTITSTVKINGALTNFLPVKTDKAVSKKYMFQIMDEIFKIEVSAPIKLGDVIVKNICESGATLVATRTCISSRQ